MDTTKSPELGTDILEIGKDIHDHLFTILKVLPTDYTDYGGEVVRWEKENEGEHYPDCSCGCKWALWLGDVGDNYLSYDWCCCSNPNSPRAGLFTFEHMAGYGCFERGKPYDE